jgi:hypothetical protein
MTLEAKPSPLALPDNPFRGLDSRAAIVITGQFRFHAAALQNFGFKFNSNMLWIRQQML